MSLDIALIRAQTPGCAHVLHLNAAGSALPSRRTLDATLDHLRLEAEIGGYEAADRARETLDGFYPSVARLIGAEAGETLSPRLAPSATKWFLTSKSSPHFPRAWRNF